MEDLKELAKQAVGWLAARSEKGVEAEVFVSRSEERGVELREGKLNGISQSLSEGMGLRILRDGRMAFGSAGGLGMDKLQNLYARVLEQIPYLDPDSSHAFATPALQGAADGELRGEVVIVNTRGVFVQERSSSANAGLSVLSEENGEVQVGSAYQSVRYRSELDLRKLGGQAAYRAASLLNGKKVPGRSRAVVFDPWTGVEFLDLISGLLSADEVQRGKSLLAGKKGLKIASPLVTFLDDPHRPGGMGSCLFDDEGLPTTRKEMVSKGVLKEYYYDLYTAAKEGRASNASAGRASYKGLPGPSSSNFYLVPGTMTREALLGSTQDGILVFDVMGLHMADPISGEFSVGVSGLLIEKGKLSGPVKNAMVSGNLLEVLERVDAVADDLTFYGSLGTPTFRVADMAVA